MKKFFITGLILVFAVTVSAKDRITLDECIQAALKNNTTLLNAKANLEDRRLMTKVTRADFLPRVSVGLDYTHQGSQTKYTQFTVLTEYYEYQYYTAGMTVSQTLWDGGNTIASNKKSKADYNASKFSFENTRQMLIYSVEEAYLNLLKQKQLLAVYEETLASSLSALKKAESMEAVGAASRTDVLKARVKAEDDRLNLITVQNNLEVAKANLNYMMGSDVNNPIEIVEIAPPDPLDIEYDEAVSMALENHPALKQAHFNRKSAEHTISSAKSAMLPEFSGYYQFGTSSVDFQELSKPLDNEYNWRAGLSLNWTLFDGLSSPANIQRAKVGKKSSLDNFEQVKRDVALEVKASYLGLEEALKSIAAASERVLSAEEDLKLSTARYQLGAGTILEQIDAQVAVTSARSQKIQAEYDYRFAQSRLKKAIGSLDY